MRVLRRYPDKCRAVIREIARENFLDDIRRAHADPGGNTAQALVRMFSPL